MRVAVADFREGKVVLSEYLVLRLFADEVVEGLRLLFQLRRGVVDQSLLSLLLQRLEVLHRGLDCYREGDLCCLLTSVGVLDEVIDHYAEGMLLSLRVFDDAVHGEGEVLSRGVVELRHPEVCDWPELVREDVHGRHSSEGPVGHPPFLT